MSLREVSYQAFVFSVFSRNQEKTKPLTWWSVSSDQVSQLNGSTIALISAHVRGQHMWASAQVQVLQNSGSGMVMLRFTTLSARDCH